MRVPCQDLIDGAVERNGGTMVNNEMPAAPSAIPACELCGWSPARGATYYSVTGVIIWWRWSRIYMRLCRDCSRAAFHESQARTMARGWWGLLAPLVSLAALSLNLMSYRQSRSLPAPTSRDNDQHSPLPLPLATSPVWVRPIPLIATAVAVAIVVAVGLSIYNARPPSRDESGEVTTGGSQTVTGLRVGDCISSAGPTDVEVSSLPVVPCSDPHEAEVFALITLSSLISFSESRITSEASERCLAAFSSYVGVDYGQSSLEISYLVPTEASWKAGDRGVACLLTTRNAGQTIGSLRTSRN